MTGRIVAGAFGAAALVLLAEPALAHEGEGVAGGFAAGLSHPIFGLDHLLAMVLVGIWGAFLGRPGIWVLPVVFPLVMTVGAMLGIAGVPLPAVEPGIAASVMVLGLAVAAALPGPLWLAYVIVGVFALFHGHAHGTELPGAANASAYAAGFVLATGALHVAGIVLGLAGGWRGGKAALRVAGLVIGLFGAYLLYGAVGSVA